MIVSMSRQVSALIAIAAAALAFALPATAAPISKPSTAPASAVAYSEQVTKVQFRRRGWRRGWRGGRGWRLRRGAARHGWRRGRRGWRWGRGVAIGTGVILGAILLSEAARANARRSGAWERCIERYRSFDRRTGTIVTYRGDVILCPYLR